MASPSPREHSASPVREPASKKPKSRSSGFKWKEKRPRDITEQLDDRRDDNPGYLERGYRDRHNRDDRRTSRTEHRYDRDDRNRSRSRSPRTNSGRGDSWRPRDDTTNRARDSDSQRREGRGRLDYDEAPNRAHLRNADEQPNERRREKKQEKKEKPVRQAAPSETMIVVNINDRLGTKAAIPCLASDSVKAFKAMVAAHIGRKPHEILIKRQGERPFKDQLTLQDYGVSNGVQLDLELDTGD